MQRYVLAAAAAAILAAAPAKADGTSAFLNALALAQKASGGGQLLRARAEDKPGAPGGKYGFYFWLRGKVVEIEIEPGKGNGGAGDIVKQTDKDGTPVNKDIAALIEIKKAAKVKLPDGRLLEIAAEGLKNAPIQDAKYEKDGDTLVLVVGDLRLDASTGKPVK